MNLKAILATSTLAVTPLAAQRAQPSRFPAPAHQAAEHAIHPVHVPHAYHSPFSLHQKRLSGAEHNFPYDHLTAGIHRPGNHIDLEFDVVLETEPHEHAEHGHTTYIVKRIPGFGIGIKYHR